MDRYAPVADLAARRRRTGIAAHLARLGCPIERIYATRTDAELDDLHHRETLIADLIRLGGRCRAILDLHDTPVLEEMRRAVLEDLMGAPSRGRDPLIFALPGKGRRQTAASRRRSEHTAWQLQSA